MTKQRLILAGVNLECCLRKKVNKFTQRFEIMRDAQIVPRGMMNVHARPRYFFGREEKIKMIRAAMHTEVTILS